MPAIDGYLSIMLAFLFVTTSPGPANIAVATIAMSSGRKPALLFALGLAFGLAFWGIIAATGLSAVLERSATLLTMIKIFGGIYLLWLAIQSGRSAFLPMAPIAKKVSSRRWFLRGLMLNLSNPKSVAAWLAALSMGLGGDNENFQLLIATSLCILLGFGNFIGYALAFSMASFANRYKRMRRWIDGTVALLFVAAGLGLIRSAVSR